MKRPEDGEGETVTRSKPIRGHEEIGVAYR